MIFEYIMMLCNILVLILWLYIGCKVTIDRKILPLSYIGFFMTATVLKIYSTTISLFGNDEIEFISKDMRIASIIFNIIVAFMIIDIISEAKKLQKIINRYCKKR